MQFSLQEFLTLTFTLFAVIDILGSIPMLISIKQKAGAINAIKVTLISGALMVLFFFIGKPFLNVLGAVSYTHLDVYKRQPLLDQAEGQSEGSNHNKQDATYDVRFQPSFHFPRWAESRVDCIIKSRRRGPHG